MVVFGPRWILSPNGVCVLGADYDIPIPDACATNCDGHADVGSDGYSNKNKHGYIYAAPDSNVDTTTDEHAASDAAWGLAI